MNYTEILEWDFSHSHSKLLQPTAVKPSQKSQFYRTTSDVTCPVSDDSATTEDNVCKSVVYQLGGIHVMPKLQTGDRR